MYACIYASMYNGFENFKRTTIKALFCISEASWPSLFCIRHSKRTENEGEKQRLIFLSPLLGVMEKNMAAWWV